MEHIKLTTWGHTDLTHRLTVHNSLCDVTVVGVKKKSGIVLAGRPGNDRLTPGTKACKAAVDFTHSPIERILGTF
jgi:hypothetical protein